MQFLKSRRNLLFVVVGIAAFVMYHMGRFAMGFVPGNTSNKIKSNNKNHDQCEIDYLGIAQRRQLQDPQAAARWLQKIVETPAIPPFDHNTDLFVFEHILKTGGTSFSAELSKMFGQQGIVPGSLPSGYFIKQELEDALQKVSNATRWWESKRVAYSHTFFQKANQRKTGNFESWFLDQIPVDPETGNRTKRVWMGTLFRHPLGWLASSHFEWMCKLGVRMELTWKHLHPHEKMQPGGPKNDESCWGMNNLTLLADHWLHHILPKKCAQAHKKDTNQCQKYARTKQDPTPHCQSATNLAQSTLFQTQLRDHPLYLTRHRHAVESLVTLEKLTFQRYGGFVPHNHVPVAWLGLTERYDESLVLFYDWLGWPLDDGSVGKNSKQRYKTCRPTSFWSQDDQQILSGLMIRSFVVHNVANAILDVRMAAWCCRRHVQGTHNWMDTERAMVHRFCQKDQEPNVVGKMA